MGDVADMKREEEILPNAILNEPMFEQYLKKLMQLIRELTTKIPSGNWIKQANCGHVAMYELG